MYKFQSQCVVGIYEKNLLIEIATKYIFVIIFKYICEFKYKIAPTYLLHIFIFQSSFTFFYR